MCSHCKTYRKPSDLYPAFVYRDVDGSLVAAGATSAICRQLASERARANGWTIELETRKDSDPKFDAIYSST